IRHLLSVCGTSTAIEAERLQRWCHPGNQLSKNRLQQAQAQLRAGNGALARLSRMRVAVVGASGTGSLMMELLLRAGAGEILVFEFDVIKGLNLNRILHARRRDADENV